MTWTLNVSWLCLNLVRSDIREPLGPSSLLSHHLSTRNDSSKLPSGHQSFAAFSVARFLCQDSSHTSALCSTGQRSAPRLLLAWNSDAEGSHWSVPSEYISSSPSFLSVAGDPQQESLPGCHGLFSQEDTLSLR